MNIKKPLILTIILLISSIFPMFSQKNYSIEFMTHFGEVTPHRQNFPPLSDKITLGLELNYLINCRSYTYYNLAYNFPTRGYGISFTNLRNRDILGQAISTYSFIEFTIAKNENFTFSIRPNAGIAYITKSYDPVSNPDNIVIGSTLNFHFNLNAKATYHVSEFLDLKFGGGLLHFSNGSSRKPNLGLNLLYLSLGLSQKIKTNETKISKDDYLHKFSPHEFWIMGTVFGADEYSKGYNGRGRMSLCTSFSSGYNYQYSGMGKLGISLDVFYNSNYKTYYHSETNSLKEHEFTKFEIPQIGIGFCHHLIFKRFELTNAIGIYSYNKVKPSEHFYMRIGGKYYITRNFFINTSLKFIGFKAQYIEPGIGFSIKSKNYKYAQTRASASGR